MNTAKNTIENHLTESIPRWFAVRTRYKAEKDVARRLARKQIECYVPINRVVRQYASKRKVVELPLIHNYAFVRIVRKEYVPVLETEHVVRFLNFSGNLISIPDEEITLLKRICQEIEDIATEPLEFEKYLPVEIIGGNLTGISGKLIEQRGRNFLVELDHIGIQLHMEIDKKLLKPTGSERKYLDDDEESLGQKYWH